MNTLLLTVIIATLLVIAAIFSLSIGWLTTGKSKIKGGFCGRAPSKKVDDSYNGDTMSYDICKKPDDDKK